jgi:hypothetical protein
MTSVDVRDAAATEKQAKIHDATRQMLELLVRVPRAWLVAVLAVAALSTLKVSRDVDGDVSVSFQVTTATIVLVGLAWLPALLRIFAVVGKGIKGMGLEVTGVGLLPTLLHSFESTGTIVRAEPVPEESASELRALESHPAEKESEEEAPEAYDWEAGSSEAPGWTRERGDLYERNRDIFLAHRIRPSTRPGQSYDVFVFLVGAHDAKPADIVAQADFFLGRYWSNRVISVSNSGVGETLGMTTAAYGPALCICRVVFKDPPGEAILHRFLDFEMAWVFEAEGVST